MVEALLKTIKNTKLEHISDARDVAHVVNRLSEQRIDSIRKKKPL